nr:hypothetical protein CFP56_43736 [Quercus suber]
MSTSNRITKVAIIGASGNSGHFMTAELLKNGKHTVTAITRTDSTSEMPEGVLTKKVDYSKPETLVDALKGQDALVVTLSGLVPKETSETIVRAAGEAGVPWIFPNEWSPDTSNEALTRDVAPFQPKVAVRKAIAELGKSNFISVVTGFWYEWSLAIPAAFGIDFVERTATLFDDGETPISTTTWPQVGRGVAALLSLPIKPEGPNKEACLEALKNQVVYMNSFTVTQKEMLASALRVTGTTDADWTTTKEPSHERYAAGLEQIKEGQRIGFAKMMYTRVFYPDGCGDFEHNKGTLNAMLGLPKEDLDAATQRALERSKGPQWTGK